MSTQRWRIGIALACSAIVLGLGPAHQAKAAGSDGKANAVRSHTLHSRAGYTTTQYVQDVPRDQRRYRARRGSWSRSVTVPQGSTVAVTVNSAISTETAHVGDAWSGVTQRDVIINGQVAIPAGTSVSGTVTQSRAARRGDRAVLGLAMDSFNRDGRNYSMHGSMEPIVAGSTRARNLGVIAGGAAAGAVVGHAIGKSGKGTLIGGLLGGAAAYGLTSRTRGYQVEFKPPVTVDFVIDEPVAVQI